MEVIIGMIGIPLLLLLVLFLRQVRKGYVEEDQIHRYVNKAKPHLATLLRKRNQLITTDDYGNLNFDAWHKELNYFMKNTLGIHLPSNQEDANVYNSIKKRIVNLVIDYEQKEINKLNEKLKRNEEVFLFNPLMSPYEYEHFCKEILISQGFDARVTQASGDQGVDVIVYDNNTPFIAIQCKMYSSPVGNKAVQEVYAAKQHIGADMAIVVTNNTYTKSARELANTTNILLLHHDDLRTLMNVITNKDT